MPRTAGQSARRGEEEEEEEEDEGASGSSFCASVPLGIESIKKHD